MLGDMLRRVLVLAVCFSCFATMGAAQERSPRTGRTARGGETGARGPGSLPDAVVMGVVRRHAREVRACYESAFANEPGLGGRIVVEWTIARDGSVSAVSVATDTVGSASMRNCIADEIRRWTFPAPDGGAMRVTFPFVFGTGGQPSAE